MNPRMVVREFLETLSTVRNAKNSLTLSLSDEQVMGLRSVGKVVEGGKWASAIEPNETFDFIMMDMPLGMARREVEIGDSRLNIRGNWVELFKALNLLEKTGICIALVEPPAFGMAEGPRFLEALEIKGFRLNGIFNVPPDLLTATRVRPVLVVFSREDRAGVFVTELEEEAQAAEVAEAFVHGTTTDSLSKVTLLKNGKFDGFESLRVRIQLERLKAQYKEYKTRTLGKLAEQINTVKPGEQLEHKDNSIYVPMIGLSPVTDELSAATAEHHDLIQVVLPDNVKSQYVSAFFRSDLGLLILRSLTRGTVNPKISKTGLAQAQVALPALKEQVEMIRSHSQLDALSIAIAKFKTELALNPKNASAIKGQVDSMLEQIGALTNADRIMSMAREGESATVEFKESFSVDIKKGSKAKYIELAALKTIAAFLNTNGGALLIGVSDRGDIRGIEDEVKKFYKSQDAFLLHFKNLLKKRIGEQFYPFVEQHIVDVGEAKVLMVDCSPASVPCFLDEIDFYVRTNPSTDKLEGTKLYEYMKNHFDR